MLESALAQPQATFGGQLLHPTIAEQAAAYLYHIAMNHPFIDGNKRSDECGDGYVFAFEWLLFEFDGRSSIRFSYASSAGNDD
ncbi:Fic family protein [Microcoleus sp. herbarium14]|uniref:type II toxin-antitoxin system death-on-curing family toxin n=1 Tax=Microcoleus sp. herbarium14 TaxID=3055439 RepID=UPI002FD42481